jgi:predicted dehydrogenase
LSESLRYAVVGAGVIGEVHVASVADLAVDVVAVVDPVAERRDRLASATGGKPYADVPSMLAGEQPDLVIVATPPTSHAAVAVACLDAGAHVMVEKPIAVEVAEADAIQRAAERAGRLAIVDLQYRYMPSVERAKQLIDAGAVGRVLRASVSESMLRTTAYYRDAPWRATWAGEGGGVLANQAPHALDVLCYLLGQPRQVVGWTRRLLHDIECEDTAMGLVEFDGGALAQLVVSTADPAPIRASIVGLRGELDLHRDTLALTTWEPDIQTHVATQPLSWVAPAAHREEQAGLPVLTDHELHTALHRDVAAALREGREPRATIGTTLPALEVANAIIQSAHLGGATVSLPLDRGRFARLIAEKRAAHGRVE